MTSVGAIQAGGRHSVVLFDGVCNLCNASVRFIVRRDRHDRFRFAPLQGEVGAGIAAEFGLPDDLTTFYLIESGEVFERSDAWLRIFRRLGPPWAALYAFAIFPRPLRDWVYGVIGRNRYRWFGRLDHCPAPDPALRHKFLS